MRPQRLPATADHESLTARRHYKSVTIRRPMPANQPNQIANRQRKQNAGLLRRMHRKLSGRLPRRQACPSEMHDRRAKSIASIKNDVAQTRGSACAEHADVS